VVLVPFFPDFTGATTTGAASTYKQIKNKQQSTNYIKQQQNLKLTRG